MKLFRALVHYLTGHNILSTIQNPLPPSNNILNNTSINCFSMDLNDCRNLLLLDYSLNQNLRYLAFRWNKQDLCEAKLETKYIKCHASTKQITEIYLDYASLNGNLDMTLLNKFNKLTHFTLTNSHLRGNINFKLLPRSLILLDISYNKFKQKTSMNINLNDLPENIEYLDISHNQFNKEIMFADLPKRLHTAVFSYNEFSGIIDLYDLSIFLTTIYLDGNKFSNLIGWSYHDNFVKLLDISNNPINIAIDLSLCSPHLSHLRISSTDICITNKGNFELVGHSYLKKH